MEVSRMTFRIDTRFQFHSIKVFVYAIAHERHEWVFVRSRGHCLDARVTWHLTFAMIDCHREATFTVYYAVLFAIAFGTEC